jgi:hypothetical protein
VRDGQYTYAELAGFSAWLDGDSGAVGRTNENGEQWASVDGSGRDLWRDENGELTWFPANKNPSLASPTYRLLESLPTDTAALLEMIYADAELNHGSGTGSSLGVDQGAFVIISDILTHAVLPPDTNAALLRAAAAIPGVVRIPEAEDALGRHGVAIAREHDGERLEWIFDEDTMRLLGQRTVLTEDGGWGEAGSPVDSTAIVRTGIVDEPGQVPERPAA